ncbi:MAG: hypothetical protein NC043_06000 [Muribaculaceae bacterium]|nr:hypothetical protein [Muribaculaceae bacterium]
MKKLRLFMVAVPVLVASGSLLSGCIEDGVSTSPSDQPVFSTDTLHMGEVFTGEGTPTHSFKVYNRHDKILAISDIQFRQGSGGMFRANVDGLSGTHFSNVEIRPNDSIYVFVEATVPASAGYEPLEVEDAIEFTVNGVRSEVVLTATGRNYERMQGTVLTRDTVLRADRAHRVFDSLTVAPGVTLTLEAGTRLYFHDKAVMRVHGTLRSEGTPEAPVWMRGDRTGIVAADIPYEVMSRQWEGVVFSRTSRDNRMVQTVIENTWSGVVLDSITAYGGGQTAIELVNCRLRNAHGYVLEARMAGIKATGCELAEGGSGVLLFQGGEHVLSHCTVSNNYLFTYPGPAVVLAGNDPADDMLSGLTVRMANCVLWGLGAELSHGELDGTDVWLRRCVMSSTGTDDDHFVDMIWEADEPFYTDRATYLFDYRLLPDCPAIGWADASATPEGALPLPTTDFYGQPHPSPASAGAMEPRPW